jgi:hypothetical protein
MDPCPRRNQEPKLTKKIRRITGKKYRFRRTDGRGKNSEYCEMSEHAPWWLTHIAGPILFTSFGAVLGFPWASERLTRRFRLLPLEEYNSFD